MSPIQLPNLRSPLNLWWSLVVLSLGMIGVALGLQFLRGLTPCSLCIFSRIAVFLVLLWSLLGLLTSYLNKPWLAFLWLSLSVLSTLGGIAVSIRHVWLLYLPPEKVPACGPGLNYLIDTLPLHEVVVSVLQGSGECAKTRDMLLGLPLAPLDSHRICNINAGSDLVFMQYVN